VTVSIAWSEAAGAEALAPGAVAAAVDAALAHGGRPGLLLSVVFVDDAEIAALHGQWFGDPTPTDVISFDLGADDPGPAGELYVSVERARAEARARGLPLERELTLYLVHGTLHLCGYDDHGGRERARMRAAEGAVLAALGHPPASGAGR
jgi:probable rRNA maturation factor